jgi:hypothetical protein
VAETATGLAPLGYSGISGNQEVGLLFIQNSAQAAQCSLCLARKTRGDPDEYWVVGRLKVAQY